jgi:DNA-binding protein HU-beta
MAKAKQQVILSKSALVDKVWNVDQESYKKKDVHEIVTMAFEAIFDSLKNGDKAVLQNIGSLKMAKRNARVGVNPQNRKKINIPAKNTIKFIASKTIKDEINK